MILLEADPLKVVRVNFEGGVERAKFTLVPTSVLGSDECKPNLSWLDLLMADSSLVYIKKQRKGT